jgi:hypothetical protein
MTTADLGRLGHPIKYSCNSFQQNLSFMFNPKRIILLSTCLTILFVMPFVHGQETPAVLRPNQLITFSLAQGQEKVFVLQMKKGDFADIQSLAGEGLNLSVEIYDSARKKLLEKSFDDEDSIWFVAQTDGDFVLVSNLNHYTEISGAQRISIQYNNKFKLPVGTKQEAVRRINGYDVRIMRTPGTYAESKSVVWIEKNRQLKRILKSSGGDPKGFSFPYPDYLTKADTAYMTKAAIGKENRIISLIKSTIDKTGDGIPDVMIQYFSGGAHCCSAMYFINLGETVETVDVLGMGDFEVLGIDKNPAGGLLFRTADGAYGFWLTSFATSAKPVVVLDFKNGKLQLNFDLMKKPAPSLAVLKNKAEFYRQKLSLAPYRGEENTYQPPDFIDPFYKEDAYPNNGNETYKGVVYRNVVFWGPMLDLIYTGNEELAWQFLDLVWPPQKQGKALFIRDFKKQLLESHYWKMILEDSGNPVAPRSRF